MSWTQVYITGLPKSILPTDEDIESILASTYSLADSDPALLWAGPGTTLVKRDDSAGGQCRGFAFLAFHSTEGAQLAVERINTSGTTVRAEISKPKPKSKKKKKGKGSDGGGDDMSDLRLRRQRGAPIRKHPVITSSNGKRTNLGQKTK